MTHGEASRETRRVTEALLGHLGAGNLEGVAALFADEVDWRLSWPDEELGGSVPWIRARRTREDAADHFRALAEHNAPHDGGTTIERILVDGHDAVVLGTIRNVMRRTGEPYRAHVALHLGVEEGRIRRYHVYEDSLAVSRAWHGRA
jgi:ketosteroid isomerase-like protein